MNVHLYKVSGYEEAIMSLRMSKGKFYSWDKAQDIQDLVYVCTDSRGFLAGEWEHHSKYEYLIDKKVICCNADTKVTGSYKEDIAEFQRLLGLTMNNAMGEFSHHTLMKYIDISFFTEGLHRGAQDDLDAHAIAFNNRITRFSTRLAEIPEAKLSEWYQDKLISFHDAHHIILSQGIQYAKNDDEKELAELVAANSEGIFHDGTNMPEELLIGTYDEQEMLVYKYTPFGYMLDKYANMSPKSGLYKDVARGGMPIGMESNALWKIDLFNLRYVYHMRSKLTKANPELKQMMEMLADQIEANVPVFGPYFRQVYTDTGKWEHTNKVRTVTKEEYEMLQEIKNDEVKRLDQEG
ncbi:Thymidylate synthase ThyX [compost metagenome]